MTDEQKIQLRKDCLEYAKGNIALVGTDNKQSVEETIKNAQSYYDWIIEDQAKTLAISS